ncbi:Eif4g3-1 protein [Aphelenchoides bicaudatus]|nr:Eif4g3-1 protein [Aphelenchoides bicaudatus]
MNDDEETSYLGDLDSNFNRQFPLDELGTPFSELFLTLNDLYWKGEVDLRKQKYSTTSLKVIRDIVRYHKKVLLPVNPNLLIQKGIYSLDSEFRNREAVSTANELKIRSILNKLTWQNYDQLCLKFVQHSNFQNECYHQLATKLIVDKAASDPLYSQLYAQLCKETSQNFKSKHNEFCNKLFVQINSAFQWNSTRYKRIDELSEQVHVEKDEQVRADLEERIEFLVEKLELEFNGNLKFFAQLYIVGLKTNNERCLSHAIELLESIGAVYFGNRVAKGRRWRRIASFSIDCFVKFISTDECKQAVSTRMRSQIAGFKDFVYDVSARQLREVRTPCQVNKRPEPVHFDDYKENNEQVGTTWPRQQTTVNQKPFLDPSSSVRLTYIKPPLRPVSLKTLMNTEQTLATPSKWKTELFQSSQ